MLTIAVGVFITIDVAILLIYTVLDGARGKLQAELQPNDENIREEFGVSFYQLHTLFNDTILHCYGLTMVVS